MKIITCVEFGSASFVKKQKQSCSNLSNLLCRFGCLSTRQRRRGCPDTKEPNFRPSSTSAEGTSPRTSDRDSIQIEDFA